MKTRDSGMPDEELWASFFTPEETLVKLGLTETGGDVVDFGCGYGTFTISAARIVRGTVHALDVEPIMVDATLRKARELGMDNVCAEQRDFVTHGSGLINGAAGYVMLFNILHCEQPEVLLREAWRILRDDGLLAIIHWNHDPLTPRGPSMDIRPKPEQCLAWAEAVGFRPIGDVPIALPPYHYGMALQKRA